MKKLMSMFLVLAMFMACASAAYASGMGVQVIGGAQTETGRVSLDDIKLNVGVDVPGFGKITPTSYAAVDFLGGYRSGTDYYLDDEMYKSGNEAEYAILKIDILNTKTAPINYLDQAEVKVVSDDTYEFSGWFYQFNYNNSYGDIEISSECVIHPDDIFSIDPMYIGHYAFGCTLPNSVINAKTPLRMIITIGGNELTYNIRK